MREAALAIDPRADVDGMTTMDELVPNAGRAEAVRVLAAFAAIAAVLAAVGPGAASSLAVAGRRREFAIRAVLGAGHRQLGGLNLGQMFGSLLVGIPPTVRPH